MRQCNYDVINFLICYFVLTFQHTGKRRKWGSPVGKIVSFSSMDHPRHLLSVWQRMTFSHPLLLRWTAALSNHIYQSLVYNEWWSDCCHLLVVIALTTGCLEGHGVRRPRESPISNQETSLPCWRLSVLSISLRPQWRRNKSINSAYYQTAKDQQQTLVPVFDTCLHLGSKLSLCK